MRARSVSALFLIGAFVIVEFLAHEKHSDLSLVPALTVHHHLAARAQPELDSSLIPLAGHRYKSTLLCREDSGDVTYLADRFGFNNPDEVWDKPKIDLVLVGDSYVQGWCVKPAMHFVSKLREQQLAILNLGLLGSGPLSQLGALLEYADDKKPGAVLWFYVLNDLFQDLSAEINSPLRIYLTGETQSLKTKTAQIDQVLSETHSAFKSELQPQSPLLYSPKWLLRELFRWLRPESLKLVNIPEPPSSEDIELYVSVLKQAQSWATRSHVLFLFIFRIVGHTTKNSRSLMLSILRNFSAKYAPLELRSWTFLKP
jgi:hypothetical protein